MHVDSVVKAGQPIQQQRTGAVIGRQFEAVDAAAARGREDPGRTGQPGSYVENAMLGPNLR